MSKLPSALASCLSRPLLLAAGLFCLSFFALPSLAEASRNQRTAWVTSNHIQVIDLDTAKVVGKIPLTEFIHDLQFSPDGQKAYVASSRGLRVANADSLSFERRASERSTRALGLSADGRRLVALHGGDPSATLAARKEGKPIPPAEVLLYNTEGMEIEARWQVPGMTFDVELSRDGEKVLVLIPQEGALQVHSIDGGLLERIQLVPPPGPDASHHVMMSWMALKPNGEAVVIPATSKDSSFLLDVDLSGARGEEERTLRQELGHNRRIQGLAWSEDSSRLWVTAVNASVQFTAHGLPVSWKRHSHNFVDVEPVPGDSRWVSVTPTLSAARGSGGVALLDIDGQVLRTVELLDMSPFKVAVRPE